MGCVGLRPHDQQLLPPANYAFFAPARYVVFVPGREPPCGDLVISGGPIDADYPGARAMATETRAAQTLWVLPGATQDRLAAQGLLRPA